MGHDKEPTRAGSPLQTLMIAWTVVIGLAFAPAGAYYYQSGNVRFMLAFTAAAFVIGLSLFVALAIARLGQAKRRRYHAGEIADLRKRGAIFGKR